MNTGRAILCLPTAADLPVDEQHDEQADQDEQHPRNQRNEPGLAA